MTLPFRLLQGNDCYWECVEAVPGESLNTVLGLLGKIAVALPWLCLWGCEAEARTWGLAILHKLIDHLWSGMMRVCRENGSSCQLLWHREQQLHRKIASNVSDVLLWWTVLSRRSLACLSPSMYVVLQLMGHHGNAKPSLKLQRLLHTRCFSKYLTCLCQNLCITGAIHQRSRSCWRPLWGGRVKFEGREMIRFDLKCTNELRSR